MLFHRTLPPILAFAEPLPKIAVNPLNKLVLEIMLVPPYN